MCMCVGAPTRVNVFVCVGGVGGGGGGVASMCTFVRVCKVHT